MKNIFAILEKPIKFLCRPAVEMKKITNCWDYSRVFTVYSLCEEEEQIISIKHNNARERKDNARGRKKGSEGKVIPKKKNILFNSIWEILFYLPS